MTDIGTDSTGQSTSHSLPPTTPTGQSPTKLHAMSTRSSEAQARRQSTHQQQPQTLHVDTESEPETHGLPSVGGRITRKRARSINIEEANHPRANDRTLPSPAFGGTPSSAVSTVSNSDLICICPSPPKVPRPRNAFILYRQHHQSGVVHKFPGLANPQISKIIGEHWREEDDETKGYWKRLAEDEKARHQRQYPQYKYQPRRGGKNGPAARAAAAASAGEDPGRCPKCGGRYISTPRTPSTPFGAGGMPGPGQHGLGPISTAAMQQPFITNNPRVIEQVPQHHRQSIDSPHGSMGADPRRQSSYYSHPPEPMRPVEEEYMSRGAMARRLGLQDQHDDFDMLTSPDLKRRRFDSYPDRGSPMSAMPQHRGQQSHQQQYPIMGGQPWAGNYIQQQQQQHREPLPTSRRDSAVSLGGSTMYSSHPSSAGGGNYPTGPLLHPRTPVEAPLQQRQQQSQPQSQQQQRPRDMAPPPRPSRLSTTSTSHRPVPPPPPGLSMTPHSTRTSTFDESLTLPPLKIPGSPTQNSATSDGARSLSGGGPGGLGISTPLRGSTDTQARGVEAMIMSMPYLNKVGVLRRIHPPLGPPRAGSPGVEVRGPVIAVEGDGNAALIRNVGPVVERALRASGECVVRVWTVAELSPEVEAAAAAADKKPNAELLDVEMADAAQEKLSVASGSRHNSLSAAGGSREGSKTPTPRQPGGGILSAPVPSTAYAAGGAPTGSPSMGDYMQLILDWHPKSAAVMKHVTTAPNGLDKTPVALVAGGFSLTLSDRFTSRIPIVDQYSPVDHWQWVATLWRGTVGADLIVYVRAMTGGEVARGASVVEVQAPGVMLVRVAGDRLDEKTERRLAFEVMEWVRAGSFREGYAFGGDGG